ncbi:MAG TPA: copper homeostasis membrane protein CopD [Stellaceae bacterium]|nr:copper homeostasis membrane protein CopD [Stellaceae bacterium]
MTEAWIVARFIHFAAAMAAFGTGAFRLYAFIGETAPATAMARAALDGVLTRIIAALAIATLVSAAAIIPFVAVEMTASDTAALDPSIWRIVLAETEFGEAWCWHMGFTLLLLAICLLPAWRWLRGTATLAALLVLASLGQVGHAAMDMGGSNEHVLNQMAHLTAGGLWLGGLLPLGLLLRRALRRDGEPYLAMAQTALPHFSQMGYVAVAALLLTGTVNSVMLVGSFRAFVYTPYGRLLLVKIVLFAAMVGLALVNRFRLMPRLREMADSARAVRTLGRSVLIEQALGVAILAVVAVLGTWPPAIESMGGMAHH